MNNSFDSSLDCFPESPLLHCRPRRFSINSSRSNTSLINNKDEEDIIQGDAFIVFHEEGNGFHGIVQGKHGGGLCQILGELRTESPCASEIFSTSYEDNESHKNLLSPSRSYFTELFQNHFESKALGCVEVLMIQDRCHIDSSECKLHFTSSQVFRGVHADKMIRSNLGPSFIRKGNVCYSGYIVIGVPIPTHQPLLSQSSSSDMLYNFL